MKKLFNIAFLILCSTVGFAQATNSTPVKIYKVGIFAPLYLDSVFNKKRI